MKMKNQFSQFVESISYPVFQGSSHGLRPTDDNENSATTRNPEPSVNERCPVPTSSDFQRGGIRSRILLPGDKTGLRLPKTKVAPEYEELARRVIAESVPAGTREDYDPEPEIDVSRLHKNRPRARVPHKAQTYKAMTPPPNWGSRLR